jgi:hypothetical protein
MAPLAKAIAAQRDDLLHDRQHRITDARGLRFQLGEIKLGNVAVAHDLLGGVLRDDSKPRLGARQRGFEVEVFLHAIFIGKHPPHRLGRENVAENDGIDDRRGHVGRHDCSPTP